MMTPDVKAALLAVGGQAAGRPAPAPARPSPGLPMSPPVPIPLPELVSPTPGAPGAVPAPPVPAPQPLSARRKRGAGTEPDLPANIPVPLYCPSLDAAPPGADVVLYCVLGPELTAKRTLLFYRAPGAESWTSAATTTSELGWIKAVIPAQAIAGKSLQYYLEARDAADHQIARAGRDDSPNLLLVRDDAPSQAGGVWAGRQVASAGADEAAGGGNDEDPLRGIARQRERERAAEGVHRRPAGVVFAGLSAGSGYGWHPGERLEFYDDADIEGGWIPSGLFYLSPSVGYQITDHVAVSVEGRVQFIAQNGSGDKKEGTPARGAFLVLGRLQYFLGEGNFQGTASLLAGAGDGFRLTIGPQSDVYRRNDSVRGGPFAAGAGLGVIYHFSPHLGLVVDGRGIGGFSDASAFVLDVSGGLAVAF